MCGHRVQRMVMTNENILLQENNMICEMFQYYLKVHCDGLLLYIANPGTKHKATKRSTTSNRYKIYSITAGSSYIQVPNP